jgi:hypothetical protein
VAARHPDLVAKAAGYFKEARTESQHWPLNDAGRRANRANRANP